MPEESQPKRLKVNYQDSCYPKKTQKKPTLSCRFFCKGRRRPTFPHFTAVSSAQTGLTSLFGMGRGGHCRYSHQNILSSWFDMYKETTNVLTSALSIVFKAKPNNHQLHTSSMLYFNLVKKVYG